MPTSKSNLNKDQAADKPTGPNKMQSSKTAKPKATKATNSVFGAKNMATKIMTLANTKRAEITSKGEVWIGGVKKGTLTTEGEIWVAGNKEGDITKEGEIWKAGNKIGSIESNGEAWLMGNNIGMIDDKGDIWMSGTRIGNIDGKNRKAAALVMFFGFYNLAD